MKDSPILWIQKANTGQGLLRHFSAFVYEFVSARLTVLAFFGLLNIAAYGLHYYGYVLAAVVALLFYYVITDAFDIFWTGINLEYQITSDHIIFQWGIFSKNELLIPFSNITKLTAIYDPKGKRRALLIENSDGLTNADFALSKEQYFRKLSMENIFDIDGLLEVLGVHYDGKIIVDTSEDTTYWVEKIPTATLYLKSLQLAGFVCIYISCSLGLKLIDSNFLAGIAVKDTVIKQEIVFVGEKLAHNKLETRQGIKLKLQGNTKFLHEEIEFKVSPIFRNPTSFSSYKSENIRPLIGEYKGLPSFFKMVLMIITLLSGLYILYKKGEIPFMDLSILLGLPALWALADYYLIS